MTVSNLSNQLIVPITLWGSRPPTHCISSLLLTADQRTIITGCYDGQICIWDFDDKKSTLTPRSLLFGHTQAVLCLANGRTNSATGNLQHFVSSSESGEMSLWDLSDGRCIETVKLQHVHTNIQTYTMNQEEVRFFCNGFYSEIFIIHGDTLQILFTLNSKLNPDWISALHVLRPTRSQDDVVIGLSVAGVMKVWTLSGFETSSAEPIYENESKPIRCMNALQLTCCCYNQRTLLIVCSQCWQIYDVGDFALLCSVSNIEGGRWTTGDFLSADRVVICSDTGRAYLYQLPVNCIPASGEFHNLNLSNQPELYGKLTMENDLRLLCPPAMAFYNLGKITSDTGFVANVPKIIVRGDSHGRLAIWKLPEVVANGGPPPPSASVPEHSPSLVTSLSSAWHSLPNSPCGIIDNLLKKLTAQHCADGETPSLRHPSPYRLTSSVYVPALGRLVCGREDGSIVIVSANQTIMIQLLFGHHLSYEDWPHYQILYGHAGKVNTLLYPHQLEDRYEVSHLISGGVDFSVCLWDIFTGAMLHRFSVHAGEITQMFVPPKECTARVLSCICSVSSDHSVALISLKERRCIMLASRHLFPISTIKWRPLDDFMIVGCVDGSVYVWQMETGHLDRVLHGMLADEVLSACDATSVSTAGDKFVNPAIHLFRGLRHRNLAAIRQAAVRGLHNISAHLQQQRLDVVDSSIRSRSNPLLIQGLRSNPKDQESHILFFDVESLIVQLLSEEYDLLSPNTMENRGLTSNLEYKKYAEMSCSPETQHKLTGFLTKMKDTAENAAMKIQAKAESVGFKNVAAGDISVGFQIRKNSNVSVSSVSSEFGVGTPPGSVASIERPGRLAYVGDAHMPIQVARLLMSLLHGWGVDPALDKICQENLGMLRPLRPVCFGLISKGGYMSLLLPTYLQKLDQDYKKKLGPAVIDHHQPSRSKNERHVQIVSIPRDAQDAMAQRFTSALHWTLSTSLTTAHLLSLIALANTLTTMANGSMFAAAEAAISNRRKLIRKLSRQGSTTTRDEKDKTEAEMRLERQKVHDGWCLVGALHCVILPGQLKSVEYRRPLVEILARRWQDRCIEIRQAAQTLLLAELKDADSRGRKQILEEWAPFIPSYDQVQENHMYGSSAASAAANSIQGGGTGSVNSSQPHSMVSSPITTPMSEHHANHFGGAGDHRPSQQSNLSNVAGGSDNEQDDDEDGMAVGNDSANGATGGAASKLHNVSNTSSEGRRKQATAIILFGVIGAEYGAEIESRGLGTPGTPQRPMRNHLEPDHDSGRQQERRRSVIEGFGGAGNYSLARKTAKVLSYLLLAPPSSSLPYHTSLRRASIDLIGRGFVVWEPYLDVSKILLALLEFSSCESEQIMIPSNKFGLPLTPAADSCRTARNALRLIARARAQVFITTLAKEVTRYNTMQQQQQALNILPHQTVLYRARPEILRNIEMLVDEFANDVHRLIIEATDIVLYCLDQNALKTKGLGEMFPSICQFQNVTFCTSSKRVAVGSNNGQLAIYELKTGKSQLLHAHNGPITACSFAPDGKHLASYCANENRISFWLTAVGLFGLGQAQTKCVKWHSTPPMPEAVGQMGPTKAGKLIWLTSKLIVLLFGDGKEHRFAV